MEVSYLEKVLNYYNIPIESSKFKIICPFHSDENASCLMDLETDRWYCFGCQVGGDAKDFIVKMEKCNELQAYIKLSKICKSKSKSNITIKRKTKEQIAQENVQDIIEAKDYYYNLKTVNWLDDENIDNEKNYLLNRGFTPQTLNKVKCKITYNDKYPIIFPMNDMGNFKGYVCRTTDKETEKKRKYLYNKGFSRRNTLVGKYDCSTVMVVEGFMDYLKAKQLGITYVCALLGWKITKEQITKLKAQGVKTIISALDNDRCGKKGTIELKRHFNVIRFQYPVNVKDIGEMNIEQFEKAKQKTKLKRSKIQNG